MMKRKTLCVAILGGLAMTASALAQQNGATALEEVVVTAAKRESTLQEAALAVAAYQGDQLQELEINDVQSLILSDPSMSFSRAGGEGQVFIRGVGSNLLGIGQDSSVAIHQDGVYLGRPHLALSQFLDVERVEVLRGPQGTLYGRNATAGVINVISRKPTEERQGYVSAYYGNFNRTELEAAVGGPLSDTVGFRVAGRFSNDDGFTDDLEPAGGDTIDDRSNYSLRGILDFRPSDSFSAELIAEYSEADGHNLSVQRRDNLHTSQRLGALPNPGFDQTRNELDTFQDWEVLGLTLTMNWQLSGSLSLVSITGYRDFEDDFSFNTDGVELFVTNTQYQREAEQFTQELRLATDNDGPLNWMLGGFIMTEDKKEALGLPGINFGGSFNIFATNDTTAYALFGEIYFDLSERLRLVGGLRYNDEEKDDFSKRGLIFFTPETDPRLNDPNTVAIGLRIADPDDFDFPFGSRTTKDSWDDWTPKVGLEFRPSDDMLVYGTVTKGFKSGGTNSLDTSPPFDQEQLWSYELGMKSSWNNNRLLLNGALFYYDYDDLQVSTFANGTTRIENAASADLLGLEVNLSALLADGLTFNAAATWLDTEYQDFVTTFGNLPEGGPNVVNLSGNNLINAPDFKLVANMNYEWQLAENTAYLFGQVTHQAEVFHSQFNESVIGQGDLTLLDLRAGYRFGEDEAWEVAALVRNATDEEYYQNSVRFTSLSDTTSDPLRIGAALGYPAEGRSYGVQLNYRF
jgi:iron complex outermembrane receptor protein